MSRAAPQRTNSNGRLKLTERQIFGLMAGLAILGLTIAYLAGGFAGSTAADTESDAGIESLRKPLPVNVMTLVHVDSIVQSRNYTGTVRARSLSDLGFEVGGKLTKVHVSEGSTVMKGQILAEIDTETFNAQKQALWARKAAANSQLDELKSGPRSETIKAARATMLAAKSRYEIATQNLDRRKRIRDALSDEEFDQVVSMAKQAKANLNAAQEQLAELESGTRQEQLDAQAASVAGIEASINEIDVALSKSKLIAPFDGIVTRRYLDPGSIAPASAPVIKLVEKDHLEAWIGLPVSIASTIEIGSSHKIKIEDRKFTATANAKIGELDRVTQTRAVLFVLQPEASDYVVSGQLCEISVSSHVESSGYWIPMSALAKGVRGLWSVMAVVKNDPGDWRVEKRSVEILKTDSHRVLVKGTIRDSDQIIVDGTHRVSENQRVAPILDRQANREPLSTQ